MTSQHSCYLADKLFHCGVDIRIFSSVVIILFCFARMNSRIWHHSARQHLRSKIQALSSNLSIRMIMRQLKISRNKVKNESVNQVVVVDKKRSVRPTRVSPNTEQKIRNFCKEQFGFGIRTVVKKLNFGFDYTDRNKIGVTTMRRYVNPTDWETTA